MPTILTVDDSRAVRTIVSKQVKDLGFDVQEAEDGQQGLVRLSESACDLVLLDVTMPVMDGPAMLAKMREGGNKTPVIMLTSESKRAVVAGAMKLGIADYILKPFKPEELRNKILSVLQGEPGAESVMQAGIAPSAGAAGPGAGGAARESGGKQFVDIMMVDDMENVHKKLRTVLPQHVTLNAYTSAHEALGACRDRVYRVVLVDTEIPDVNSAVLASQLKILQPHAAFVAVALRTTNDLLKEVREQGFDEVLYKPFSQDNIEDFLAQYFDNGDLLAIEDNVLHMAAYTGKADRIERYFKRLADMFPAALNKIASACYDETVLDLAKAPTELDRLPKLLVTVAEQVKGMGMDLVIVGSPEIQKQLAGFEETKAIRFVGSVQEARGGA
jgi:DNA-binding response OmpR family regulator